MGRAGESSVGISVGVEASGRQHATLRLLSTAWPAVPRLGQGPCDPELTMQRKQWLLRV